MEYDDEGPPLPAARGPLSAAVGACLLGTGPPPGPEEAATADAYGDDLQLALYQCYELHYRGLAGVDDRWEWHPHLLSARLGWEQHFLDGLRLAAPSCAALMASRWTINVRWSPCAGADGPVSSRCATGRTGWPGSATRPRRRRSATC